MTKTIKITASVYTTRIKSAPANTGKSAAKQRKAEARKTRALKVRGNKKKYQEMVNLYGLTERMAVKLLTIHKL